MATCDGMIYIWWEPQRNEYHSSFQVPRNSCRWPSCTALLSLQVYNLCTCPIALWTQCINLSGMIAQFGTPGEILYRLIMIEFWRWFKRRQGVKWFGTFLQMKLIFLGPQKSLPRNGTTTTHKSGQALNNLTLLVSSWPLKWTVVRSWHEGMAEVRSRDTFHYDITPPSKFKEELWIIPQGQIIYGS